MDQDAANITTPTRDDSHTAEQAIGNVATVAVEPKFREARVRETPRASKVVVSAFPTVRGPNWWRALISHTRYSVVFLSVLSYAVRNSLYTSGPNEFVAIVRTGMNAVDAVITGGPMVAMGFTATLLGLSHVYGVAWIFGIAAVGWVALLLAPAIPQMRTPDALADARAARRTYGPGYMILAACRAEESLVSLPVTKRNTAERIAAYIESNERFTPCYVNAISKGAAREYGKYMTVFGDSGLVLVGLRNGTAEDHDASN